MTKNIIEITRACCLVLVAAAATADLGQCQVGSGGVPPLNSRASINSDKVDATRVPQLQVTTTAVYSGTLQRAPWAAWKEDDDEP